MLGWEDTSSIPTLGAMPAWLGVLGSHVVTSQAGRQATLYPAGSGL